MEINSHGRNLERENVLVLVSPWRTPSFVYFLIEKRIPASFGFVHYIYPEDTLNEDPFLTKKNFSELIETINNDLAGLNGSKPRKFYMYGASLGSLFCAIVADFISTEKAALIVPGLNLAEAFWNGTSTRELKKKMEARGITLNKLKDIWKEISPDNYFKNKATSCEFFITLSRNDSIIPYENGQKLIELLKTKGIKFILRESGRLSHRGLVALDILLFKTAKFLFS